MGWPCEKAAELFVDPRTDVRRMHALEPGEILTRVHLRRVPGRRSHFVKVAVRGAWDFALASTAVAARLDGVRLSDCRLVLGGVAPTPWRCHAAEALLEGAAPTAEAIESAAEAELGDAEPLPQSAYRLALTRQAIVDALTEMLR